MSLKTEFFGKFILLDKIATGGMAEVYRAKAPGAEGIGKILALKRITKGQALLENFEPPEEVEE